MRNERRAPCQVTRRSRSFWRAAGLGCGTTVGRNRLANRGRAALDEPESPGILSYHQSVRAENLGVLQSILPPEMLAAGRMPKKCRRNPRIFNSLKLLHVAACFRAGNWFRLEQPGSANESAQASYERFSTHAWSQAAAPPVFSFLISKPSRFR